MYCQSGICRYIISVIDVSYMQCHIHTYRISVANDSKIAVDLDS